MHICISVYVVLYIKYLKTRVTPITTQRFVLTFGHQLPHRLRFNLLSCLVLVGSLLAPGMPRLLLFGPLHFLKLGVTPTLLCLFCRRLEKTWWVFLVSVCLSLSVTLSFACFLFIISFKPLKRDKATCPSSGTLENWSPSSKKRERAEWGEEMGSSEKRLGWRASHGFATSCSGKAQTPQRNLQGRGLGPILPLWLQLLD